jgi:4-hydroxy-tetrahydrodipicolinate reductase
MRKDAAEPVATVRSFSGHQVIRSSRPEQQTMGVRVLVAGAAGRMGREVVKAVAGDPETELVGAVDVSEIGADAGELAGIGPRGIAIGSDLAAALRTTGAEVIVDFTRAEAAFANAQVALAAGVSPVIGTTGMSRAQIDTLRELAEKHGTGAIIAPNFALGAVLLMRFAAQAARYLPEVEIIELHHEKKVDAPSGTAIKTAEMIRDARAPERLPRPAEEFKVEGARGGDFDGIRIHSVRLPGYVAHQEVIFGATGQTLTLRHDSIDRVSFMPGVLMACKRVRSLNRLVYGLENLLE